jgi:hypothetical protein
MRCETKRKAIIPSPLSTLRPPEIFMKRRQLSVPAAALFIYRLLYQNTHHQQLHLCTASSHAPPSWKRECVCASFVHRDREKKETVSANKIHRHFINIASNTLALKIVRQMNPCGKARTMQAHYWKQFIKWVVKKGQ